MTFSIALLAIIGLAAGLEVGPVRLANNHTYMSYNPRPSPNSSVLECPHELSEGEELRKISWVLWEGEEQVGTYEWYPADAEGTATGTLKGVVNLYREDGSLEFTELKYELGGFYSCSATLTDDQVKEAAKWEALVIDTTSSHTFSGSNANYTTCTYESTVRATAVFPPPTVHCGMYSDQRGGFYDEVTPLEWNKIVYPNMSTAYSFEDRVFQIDANTPDDAEFLFNLGVTKTDGTYIGLLDIKTFDNIWKREPGCDVPRVGQHQTILHSTGRKDCLGQLLPDLFDNPPKVTVGCQDGYHATGGVSRVVMVCDTEASKWTTEQGHEPNLDNLLCVVDTPTTTSHPGGGAADVASSATLVLATVLLLCLVHQ